MGSMGSNLGSNSNIPIGVNHYSHYNAQSLPQPPLHPSHPPVIAQSTTQMTQSIPYGHPQSMNSMNSMNAMQSMDYLQHGQQCIPSVSTSSNTTVSIPPAVSHGNHMGNNMGNN